MNVVVIVLVVVVRGGGGGYITSDNKYIKMWIFEVFKGIKR